MSTSFEPRLGILRGSDFDCWHEDLLVGEKLLVLNIGKVVFVERLFRSVHVLPKWLKILGAAFRWVFRRIFRYYVSCCDQTEFAGRIVHMRCQPLFFRTFLDGVLWVDRGTSRLSFIHQIGGFLLQTLLSAFLMFDLPYLYLRAIVIDESFLWS